jgi:hypothetical protein
LDNTSLTPEAAVYFSAESGRWPESHASAPVRFGPLVAFFGTGYFSGFGALTAEIYPTSIRATACATGMSPSARQKSILQRR